MASQVIVLVRDVTEEHESMRLFSALRGLLTPEDGVSSEALRDGRRILMRALGLSNREVDVVSYLSQGYSNDDIARTLFLSQHTINNHIRRVLAKFDLHHRGEIVPYVLRHVISNWDAHSQSGAAVEWLFAFDESTADPTITAVDR